MSTVLGEWRPVKLGTIERELARLWVAPDAAHREAPATRALMANLIVFCRNPAEREEIVRDIGAVLAQHPSRIVLVVADSGHDSRDIEAWVTSEARGGRVRGEQVTIHAGAPALRRLPSAVREILLGDLPTTLWWATPDAPPLAGDLFSELATFADLVVFDSFGWTDPLRQVIVTARWMESSDKVTADLAWRRPRLWRRLIAQSLDPALAPGALESISELRIEHGPHTLTQAWLLVGWLAFRLGWRPVGGRVAPGPEVTWSFEWAHGTPRVHIRRLAEGESGIRTIDIVTEVAGRAATFAFRPDGPTRVTVRAESLSERELALTGPVLSRGNLVARQLPDLVRDRLFEASMTLARTMAEAVL